MPRRTVMSTAWAEIVAAGDVAADQVVGVYLEDDPTPCWIVRAASAPSAGDARPADSAVYWFLGENRLAGVEVRGLDGTSDRLYARSARDGYPARLAVVVGA